ncbi:hypothetical protein [Pseudomonas gingeri]|uniref:hypothetical protein n=1 Tax=Pseudomonas gingeri TaxID=117681 RepID=UPI00159FF8F2|nr:hypothetical protein [Pseudomonas gingeri]NWD04118.1 hypothetical protein [Pseudomonas gingeri]NWE33916.1 hypothetical protein [Pseudomonas gingeri]NWE57998.1 hypothetical protein [Pseudomonas gingeri]NWF04357.1 hypothetical protein [Pseudomonas gingeri]
MSDAISNKDQTPAKTFTLFNQNGIKITLDLPGALQINQNRQELYTSAPILHNSTIFPIKSAKFTIRLDDVRDASSNVIANVRWWNPSIFNGEQTMEFNVEAIQPNETGKCTPASSGYSQVRWATSVSSGRAQETFTNTLNLVSLIYGPLPSNTTNQADGPIIQIG